jgi:uncharacterized protein (TIGR02266 family)
MMHNDLSSTTNGDRGSRVKQAVSLLKECIQDLSALNRNPALGVDGIVFKIADAVGFLSAVKDTGSKCLSLVTEVNSAMNKLRGALETLQTLSHKAPEVDPVTRCIAKVVALLYPLSKYSESRSPDHPVDSRTSSQMFERRGAPRIPVEAEVGFQSDTNFFMGFSEDVSLGGLFVATFDTRPLGSMMCVNFTLPGGHLISADGVVRWVREYNETAPEISPGMGVQFEDLAGKDTEAIEGFIRQRPAIFFDDE